MKDDNIIHGTYGALLLDFRWKAKRAHILKRDGCKCVVCGGTKGLNVHHKQYHVDSQGRKFVPWNYDDKYLVTLCEKCHRKGHYRYKVPVFVIKNK